MRALDSRPAKNRLGRAGEVTNPMAEMNNPETTKTLSRRDLIKGVIAAGGEHLHQDGQWIEIGEFGAGDGDLQLYVARFVFGELYDAVADRLQDLSRVACGTHTPCPESGIRMVQQLEVERFRERPRTDQTPHRMHAGLAMVGFIECERFERRADGRVDSLTEQSLRDIPLIDIRALESLEQFFGVFTSQVRDRRAGRRGVAHAIEASFESIDAGRIAVCVLITVIAIVPVENVQAPVGAQIGRAHV